MNYVNHHCEVIFLLLSRLTKMTLRNKLPRKFLSYLVQMGMQRAICHLCLHISSYNVFAVTDDIKFKVKNLIKDIQLDKGVHSALS